MMTRKGEFFALLQSKAEELNGRGFQFELSKPSLSDHKMLISIKGKTLVVDFVIETEGEKFFLLEKEIKKPFLKDDLADYMFILANDGRKSLEFYNLLKDRIQELSKNGIKFVLGGPVLKSGGVLIRVEGKSLVTFVIHQNKHDTFSFKNEGKKLFFLDRGLVSYILIKANAGPQAGVLMPEDWSKEHFAHLNTVPST